MGHVLVFQLVSGVWEAPELQLGVRTGCPRGCTFELRKTAKSGSASYKLRKTAQNCAELRRTAQNWRLVSAVTRVEYFSFEFVGMNGGSV